MLHDGIARYVGDALLLVTGGSWEWDDATARPIVRPDARLGLDAESPIALMDDVMALCDEDAIVRVWEQWSAAAD